MYVGKLTAREHLLLGEGFVGDAAQEVAVRLGVPIWEAHRRVYAVERKVVDEVAACEVRYALIVASDGEADRMLEGLAAEVVKAIVERLRERGLLVEMRP